MSAPGQDRPLAKLRHSRRSSVSRYAFALPFDVPDCGAFSYRSAPLWLQMFEDVYGSFALSQYFGLDWLAMCLTFGAIYLLGNKSRYGFVVMMIGNLCWAVIGFWAGSYAMVIANLGFFSMNVRGYLKWSPIPIEAN